MDYAQKAKLKQAVADVESWLDLVLIAVANSPLTLVIFIGWTLLSVAFGFWISG